MTERRQRQLTSPYARLVNDRWEPEVRGYDVAYVCENGHVINEHACECPDSNAPHCERCGSPAVWECSCGAPVRGAYYGTHGFFRKPPAFCLKCGKPYIWTLRNTEALKEHLHELIEIEADERAKLLAFVPDVVSDTPRTPTATARFSEALGRLSAPWKAALVDLLKTVATAEVLKQLGL